MECFTTVNVLWFAASKREKELRRIQILLGVRAHKSELRLLALAAAQSSLELSRESYSAGNTGVLQVLDAQRQRQQAQLGFVRAHAQQYLDTTQLFLALGGSTP